MTSTKYGFDILGQCSKKFKLNFSKFWRTNSFVCRNYRGKTCLGFFHLFILNRVKMNIGINLNFVLSFKKISTNSFVSLNWHFRLKLVNWNESVYCTPIDRALKMWFNEGSGSFLQSTIPDLWRFLWNQLRRFWIK